MLVPLTIFNAVLRNETTFKSDQSFIHSLHTLDSFDKVSTGWSEGIACELLSTENAKSLAYESVASPCLRACLSIRTGAFQIPS